MKKFTGLVILVITTCFELQAQHTEGNPFARLGYKTDVYTFGEKKEFHDQEEIVEIGEVLFNTKTNEVVGFVDDTDSLIELKPELQSMSIDPLCEKYYSISPYAYCMNNPVNCIDPDGRSTWVISNSDGTYRVVGGDLEDDDRSIYVWDIQNGQIGITGSIGESDLISSFYNSDANDGKGAWSIGSIIDPKDNSGIDFFNSFNKEEPTITDYMANATGYEKYDFKRAGTSEGAPNDNSIYYYRGMPIRTENGKTIYSSARDIGNYTAGYIAGHLQIRWDWTRRQFDKLQSKQAGYPTVEGYSTQNAQWHGWNAGLKSSIDNPWKTFRWTTKSIPSGIKWLIR
ncbi:MAG: hypothetical protein ACLS4S_11685 [Bacteroides nordii]